MCSTEDEHRVQHTRRSESTKGFDSFEWQEHQGRGDRRG